jgi:hypothetical protein
VANLNFASELAGWLETASVSFPRVPSLVPPMTLDHSFLPRPTLSIYTALYRHGAILGISSECSGELRSTPGLPHIPEILHPTPMQLTTVHRQWIDRFPFPRMRDNMIRLSCVIDYREFVADLFTMTSFKLMPGSVSWDPAAWKMGQEFGEKWGYVFY